MNWEVFPYQGLGPLHFGMTPEEVGSYDELIGSVTDRVVEFDGSINEHRGIEAPTCNYEHDRLVGIGTDFQVPNVQFAGFDFYREEPVVVVQRLVEANGGAHSGLGFLVFLKLGIALTGFLDDEGRRCLALKELALGDERAVSVFRRGLYDPFMDELEPIQLDLA